MSFWILLRTATRDETPDALLRNSAIYAYVSSIVFQVNIYFSVYFGSKHKRLFWNSKRIEDILEKWKKGKKTDFTWISWILLKPSLQKNSIKLEKVPGPGISARLFTDFFWAASFGVISLSGIASSLAIPNDPLVVDLCKQRTAKSICLLRRSPWKFLQHTVVNLFMTDIFFFFLDGSVKFERGKNQRSKMPGPGMCKRPSPHRKVV